MSSSGHHAALSAGPAQPLAHAHLGRRDQSLIEYSKAVQIDHELPAATEAMARLDGK